MPKGPVLNTQKPGNKACSNYPPNDVLLLSDGGVTVRGPTCRPGGKRDCTKRYYCPFCNEPKAKLRPHLESQHGEEGDVARLMACTSHAARQKMMTKLRNLGNHRHNVEVLRKGEGELVVVHRPLSDQQACPNNYLPCTECLGYYVKRDLHKHVKICPLSDGAKAKNTRHASRASLLLPAPAGVSDSMRQVLAALKSNDRVSRVVKSDELILQLGERLCARHARGRQRQSVVRASLRQMGRLLVELRKRQPQQQTMRDFVDPAMMRHIVCSTRQLAGYDEVSGAYKKPWLAMKIGHSLKKLAAMIKAESLESGDDALYEKADRYTRLHEINWKSEVTYNARRTVADNRKNTVTLLPLTADIKTLTEYLRRHVKALSEQLTRDNNDTDAYSGLRDCLLAQIVLFNRRRSGEVSRMMLNEYERAHTCSQADADEYGLSMMEKALCKHFTRVEVTGKKPLRPVAMLLTKSVQEGLDLLVSCRAKVGITSSNNFMFARLNGKDPMLADRCLNRLARECGAVRPETLVSTKLRKHVATMTQIVNLQDNELDVLADFLGHDVRVHREFYRMPREPVQLAKVSRLLMGLESGQVKECSGKRLEDIPVHLDFNEELEGNRYLDFHPARYTTIP